jgi:hypothetical protein
MHSPQEMARSFAMITDTKFGDRGKAGGIAGEAAGAQGGAATRRLLDPCKLL